MSNTRNTGPSRALGEDSVACAIERRDVPTMKHSVYKRCHSELKGMLVGVRGYPYTKCHGRVGRSDITFVIDNIVVGLLEVKNQEVNGSKAEAWKSVPDHVTRLVEPQFLALVCSGTYVFPGGELWEMVDDIRLDVAAYREGRHHRALGVKKDVEIFNREDVEDEKRFQAYLDAKLRPPVVI